MQKSSNTWKATVQSYLDKRLAWVLMLGCSSGFPWVLIGSNMSGWLKDAGFTNTDIGYFSSIFVAYSVNFLWSPLVDRLHIPLVSRWLGQRRSWIFVCQCIILLCTLAIASFSNPTTHFMMTYGVALVIAFVSATQDIAIDAFRIDSFNKAEESKLPQASAMAVIGWWTGYSLPGYLAFTNADQYGWNTVYFGMAAVMVVLIIFTLMTKEPVTHRDRLQQKAEERHHQYIESPVLLWLSVTVVEPFVDFFRRNGIRVALTILLFVFLFKIGEAFLGKMSISFYREVGFTNEQIGYYSKMIGWWTTMFFTLIGSMVTVRFGIVKGLMIGGVAMSASNLMFSWIAQTGPNEHLFLATVIVDNFTTAFSTVAFVSFLTLMTGQAFSATQYALLASLGNAGRTVLSSFSGAMVDYLNNWPLFFVLTAVMVVPSLIMLYLLRQYFTDLLEKAKASRKQDCI
ncbi:AmpG family muropeptide MFS transporter [Vibrio sp. MEBiC08052]|uniref:AmpG family muropeptide MFS transporter n=1 Tax=Vibrio sp. MEBiC08052 TaxID=1761910 RepID=UPI00074065C3|nr:AmpG permease [Vibrio sp. MEBiC08052]